MNSCDCIGIGNVPSSVARNLRHSYPTWAYIGLLAFAAISAVSIGLLGARLASGYSPVTESHVASGGDPEFQRIVAYLASTHRRDALIIHSGKRTVLGAARRFRPYDYRPTATLNVAIDTNGRRVAFPQFAETSHAGALVVRSGVAFRQMSAGHDGATSVSLSVPCATTRLAADQDGYVYLSALTIVKGTLRRTEAGLQLNAPRDGGAPQSVQLYARQETRHGIVATSSGLHLRCNRGVRLTLDRIDAQAVAFTASGEAVPMPSHTFTIVERLDGGSDAVVTCASCRMERVVALAVPEGNAPYRFGSRLGIERRGAAPRDYPVMRFSTVHDQGDVIASKRPPVLVEPSITGFEVGIDERNGA